MSHQHKSPTHCMILIVLIALEDIFFIPLYGKAIVNVSELFLILGTSIIRVREIQMSPTTVYQ